MTQQEFTNLTNTEVTGAEFEVINAMYMCNDNMDKQQFCKLFVKMDLFGHVANVVNLKVDLIEAQRRAAKSDEYYTAYCNTQKAEQDLHAEFDIMQDRALKAEKDVESYKAWWMSECDKNTKLTKRLETIKSIIEM